MIGTDSHTPNAGGLGMVAIGVGGADAVDVMTGFPFNVRWPKVIGVKLTGTLSGWSAPKDVILEVARVLTVEGGTGAIVEYFGPGADSISATGKATICNMGAEIGATCSVFGYDHNMSMYLKATGREAIADAADKVADDLRPDDGALYDQLIEIDLDQLKPLINGPHSPDRANRVGAAVGAEARANDWPLEISAALIGSCTNSSYEDITRAAFDRPPGVGRGPDGRRPTCWSRRAPSRSGRRSSATACSPTSRPSARPCSPTRAVRASASGIVRRRTTACRTRSSTRFNRNFPKRNDGSANTLSFVTSPDTVDRARTRRPARLRSRPPTRITAPDGTEVLLEPPVGEVLPDKGYDPGENTFTPPPADGSGVVVEVSPTSDRLQLLQPFPAWDGNDYLGLPILMKAKGKCTTDHISAAGKWLTYRGHLENISGNLFLGAVNAFDRRRRRGRRLPRRQPRHATRTWPRSTARPAFAGCAIGDRNYGEGSSREHAAMEPRFRGGVVIFARSFARIHETNLKKQGLVPLTFADPGHLRPDRGGRPHQRARPAAEARPERALPDRQARRRDRSTSRACTPSATSRSSGSGPARRSTSCAARSPPNSPADVILHVLG